MRTPEVHGVHLCLLICLCAQIIVGTLVELCGPRYDKKIPGKVYLRLYDKQGDGVISVHTTADKPELIAPYIDPKKPTVIQIHGWTESTATDTCILIVTEYAKRGDVNVMAIDWSESSQDFSYPKVCYEMPAVGNAIATAIAKLSNRINPRTLHVIGYSLGAHVAGYVGKFANQTIGRITGLEPALPLFYPGPGLCHITPNDAEIVVVVHTGSQIIGTYKSTGTLDIFVNRGMTDQPGCSKTKFAALCSHDRSVRYFAEAINNPRAFPAYKCSQKGRKDQNDTIIYLGDNTPGNIRGDYCTTTNSKSPYGIVNAK